MTLLEMHGIGKEFGAIRALSEVDFAVDAGEVVGLMGDNGAGKSTLVKIIAGNFPPTHGAPASRWSTRTWHWPTI
jgi:simple sugar transport system ATP-binding protein